MTEDGVAPGGPAPYTSTDVADAAGISYRMLDYWRTSGLVRPSVGTAGSGNPTHWSGADLRYVVAVAGLSRAGVDLKTLRANPTPDGVRALCISVLSAVEDALAVLGNDGAVSSGRKRARR